MRAVQEEKIVLPGKYRPCPSKQKNNNNCFSWLESDTLKYVYTGKFKVSNSLKQLKKHLEWMHNDKVQTLSEGALDILVILNFSVRRGQISSRKGGSFTPMEGTNCIGLS